MQLRLSLTSSLEVVMFDKARTTQRHIFEYHLQIVRVLSKRRDQLEA